MPHNTPSSRCSAPSENERSPEPAVGNFRTYRSSIVGRYSTMVAVEMAIRALSTRTGRGSISRDPPHTIASRQALRPPHACHSGCPVGRGAFRIPRSRGDPGIERTV
jgi:hypothetical protein